MFICRILEHSSDNTFLNLALEQAILQLHPQGPYDLTIRFWRNPKSVIVGRNQSVKDEVNTEYCKRNKIIVGRRISGGGTVYHDKGNLNLSFFIPKKVFFNPQSNMTEITEFFTDLIIKSLENIGLTDLKRVKSSNIFYQGLKVSGSAEYHSQGYILHHATLLLSANLLHLENSLLVKDSYNKGKNKSMYFPTTNLPSFDLSLWKKGLFKIFEENWKCILKKKLFTQEEYELGMKLTEKMYTQKSWIFDKKRIVIK
ncbi:MAG: biotin/lipoate A/B protein ligase family protein [Candidatus Hodarchaeota archaeon]